MAHAAADEYHFERSNRDRTARDRFLLPVRLVATERCDRSRRGLARDPSQARLLATSACPKGEAVSVVICGKKVKIDCNGSACFCVLPVSERVAAVPEMSEQPRKHDIIEDPRDKALVEAFIAGDMAGFRFVYSRYQQRVMSYCLYYMGDHQSAEDAFQEVFSRAYTRREQLRETKALKSWLLLITRSVCLNLLRTSKFTPTFVSIEEDAESENPHQPKELSVEPNSTLVADDLLKQALAKLAPIYRDAFLLREFEGYEYEEIAQMTETSVMNVKVRITRAKKRLRTLLAPYYAATGGRAPRPRTTQEESEEETHANDMTGDIGTSQEVFAT